MTDATVQTIEPKTLESIRTVANIGSGTMGHATALQFAVAGYPVKLVDCSEELLKRGIECIRADAEEFAQAGLLRAEDTVDDVLSAFRHTPIMKMVSPTRISLSNPLLKSLMSSNPYGSRLSSTRRSMRSLRQTLPDFGPDRNPICAEAPGTLCDGSFLESWASDAASRSGARQRHRAGSG